MHHLRLPSRSSCLLLQAAAGSLQAVFDPRACHQQKDHFAFHLPALQVNAAVLRKANATPGCLFMCHIKSPHALRTAAVSGQQVAYQGVLALQLCFKPADSTEYGDQQWRQLVAALAPVLRKAYQHVHNCQCDVVQLLSAA